MHRSPFIAGALLSVAGSVALTACGSSSSSTAAASSSVSVPGNASFCTQIAAAASHLAHFGLIPPVNTGSATDIAVIKQEWTSDASAFDGLDSSAPSDIKPAFDTMRAALDKITSNLQSATSGDQLGTAFDPLHVPAVAAAGATISHYIVSSCGITSASTT